MIYGLEIAGDRNRCHHNETYIWTVRHSRSEAVRVPQDWCTVSAGQRFFKTKLRKGGPAAGTSVASSRQSKAGVAPAEEFAQATLHITCFEGRDLLIALNRLDGAKRGALPDLDKLALGIPG